MPDFRAKLYNHYVSKFKEMDSQLSDQALLSYFAWCEHKFLPLFTGRGPETAILELGCGPGYMLKFLAQHGFTQIKGIDISVEQIEQAHKHGHDAEVAEVFEYIEGKHDAFDVIIALDFIEHFHKEELLALSQCIFKSLKKDGMLILQTPNGGGLFPHQIIYSDLTHLTVFTPVSLKQLLGEAGFCNFRFYETGPTSKNMKGRLRLFLWRLIKFIANAIRRIENGKSQAIWTENMICCCEKSDS